MAGIHNIKTLSGPKNVFHTFGVGTCKFGAERRVLHSGQFCCYIEKKGSQAVATGQMLVTAPPHHYAQTGVRQGTHVNVAFYRPQVRCSVLHAFNCDNSNNGSSNTNAPLHFKINEAAKFQRGKQANCTSGLSSNWKTEYLYTTVSKKSIIGLEIYFKYNQFITKTNGSARAGSHFLTFVRRWNNMGPCVPQRGRPSICKQTPVKRKHNWTLRLGHLQKP